MDGYAIGAEDASRKFRIAGTIKPGTRPDLQLHAAECARILTGAEIPAGAVKVLKQEDVHVEADWIIQDVPCGADYIRHRGEDARAGSCLMRSGVRLAAAEIALLASLGIVEPLVSAQCRVAHFATGDEIVDPGEAPGPSGIRDSNSALVRAFIESHGGAMKIQERVADDLDSLTEKASSAMESGCDLLLISGGASVGAYDFGRAALLRLGFEFHFEKLNLRPGKPLAFATRGREVAFVLPGNPLSHLVLLHCAVAVALDCMAGTDPGWRVMNATLRAGIHGGGDGRETLWPARINMVDGEPFAEPLRWQSSGDMTGLAGVNAFIRCNVPALDTGARVPCILIHG